MLRIISLFTVAQALFAQETSTTHHAKGTFTVKIEPVKLATAEGLARLSGVKQIHGDLEATTKGEMLAWGDPGKGEAGIVMMEIVTGTLMGKRGTFTLQGLGAMDRHEQRMTVTIVPGSGTGALTGIVGRFDIRIENGQHFYDLEYSLPKTGKD